MLKVREIRDPTSCLNKAEDDELIFVLLERDPCAPYAVRSWADERVRIGKNHPNDPQIIEALNWPKK